MLPEDDEPVPWRAEIEQPIAPLGALIARSWILLAGVLVAVAVVGAVLLLRGGDPPERTGTVLPVPTSPDQEVPGEEPTFTSSPELPVGSVRPTVRLSVTTFGTASLRSQPNASSDHLGDLDEGVHDAYCKVAGELVRRGDAYNSWWLLTDHGGSYAYFSAYYLRNWGDDEAKDDDGIEIPDCPE